jgi:hypothetical protein
MLIEILVAILTIVPAMAAGKKLAQPISKNPYFVTAVQVALGGGFVYLLTVFTSLALFAVAMAALGPLTINLIALINHKRREREVRKTRDGEYGEVAKWGQELIDEGDDGFVLATQEITQEDMMEIGIVAENKEELRQLAMERLDEQTDDQIPKDFGQ